MYCDDEVVLSRSKNGVLIKDNITTGEILSFEQDLFVDRFTTHQLGNEIYSWDKSWIYKESKENYTKIIPISALGENIELVKVYQIETDYWVTTLNNGVYQVIIKEDNIEVNNYLEGEVVPSVLKDKSGNIWMATFGSGLFKLNKSSNKIYNSLNGLVQDEIQTFYVDGSLLLMADISDNLYVSNASVSYTHLTLPTKA